MFALKFFVGLVSAVDVSNLVPNAKLRKSNVNNAIRGTDMMNLAPSLIDSSNRAPMEKESQGMPFWFVDLRNNMTTYFRAYLEGITENYSPSWNTQDYPGRSEPVYTYQKAERDISFTLKVFPGNQTESKVIWNKLNHLSSLVYPEYAIDSMDWSAKMRMKPPFCKLRIGEYIGNNQNKGQLGFIKSLAYSVPESSPWETIPGVRKPKHLTAAITFQCISYGAPDMNTNFYGSR